MGDEDLKQVWQEYYQQQADYEELRRSIRKGVAEGIEDYRQSRDEVSLKIMVFCVVGAYFLLGFVSFLIDQASAPENCLDNMILAQMGKQYSNNSKLLSLLSRTSKLITEKNSRLQREKVANFV